MKFTYLIQQLIKQSAQDGATLVREYRGGGITILSSTTSGEGEGDWRARSARRGAKPL